MREYKFRFWDTFDKKEPRMIYFNFGKLMGGSVYPDMKTVMQYTGLKDKNGKEIYEGDVFFMGTEPRYVGFEDGVFFTYKKNGWQQESLYGLCLSSSVEIIGNIYENPELLQS